MRDKAFLKIITNFIFWLQDRPEGEKVVYHRGKQ